MVASHPVQNFLSLEYGDAHQLFKTFNSIKSVSSIFVLNEEDDVQELGNAKDELSVEVDHEPLFE